jgi:hypothetical protein
MSNPFQSLFNRFPQTKDLNPIELLITPFILQVAVMQNRPPRHPDFEIFLDQGRSMVEKLFSNRPIGENPLFVFPEMWSSVHEERDFINSICHHPQVSTIKTVQVITRSAIILTDCLSSQVMVFTFDDDEPYRREPKKLQSLGGLGQPKNIS